MKIYNVVLGGNIPGNSRIGAEVAGRKVRYIRLELNTDTPTYFHLQQVKVYGRQL